MILLFSSSFIEIDPQIDFLISRLKERKILYHFVNPYFLEKNNVVLCQEKSKISLTINNEKATPTLIYMANLWRTDCINVLTNIKYPSVFRSRIQQFLQDMRFVLDQCTWVPGNIIDLEKSDSKPFLFREAYNVGLKTPLFTYNAFVNNLPLKKAVYRKNLGYPFTISLNTEKGIEVGVTTTNIFQEMAEDNTHQPWQWQEPIESYDQIRCFIVNDTVWSIHWHRDEKITDFRLINNVYDKETTWTPFKLPQEEIQKLLNLMKKMNISVAAPEFLISLKDEFIFIDLNPCGDWFGFFGEDIKEEIVEKLVNLLIQ